MARRVSVLVLVLVLLPVLAFGQSDSSIRMEYPNDFGIELLGRSVIYTFTYQRMLNNYVGLEGGLSALGGGDSNDSATLVFIPIGGRFYMIPKNGSPFLTGGMVILTASVDSGPFDDSESNTYGYVGLGFEFRAEGGFIFRGTAYGLISDGNFFIWPGLHIGYAF